MAKRFSEGLPGDYRHLLEEIGKVAGSGTVQEAAQAFVGLIFGRFSASLVLVRLFITVPLASLPEEDRQFVARRGECTGTSHLIREATPVFTLLGTCGRQPPWNDRRASALFRCIPLASTAFVASLPMLSRQFGSVGLDLDLIDDWENRVAATARGDRYTGMLYIRDAGTDRDEQGRMIVPKQDFVSANRVRTTAGFGTGYAGQATLLTLFAFCDEIIDRTAIEPLADLLERFRDQTEERIGRGALFPAGTDRKGVRPGSSPAAS